MRHIKPTHKPIQTFYTELKQYEKLGATNETEVRLALLTTQQFGCNQIMLKFTTTEAILKIDWSTLMMPLLIMILQFVSIRISPKHTTTGAFRKSYVKNLMLLL